MKVSAEHLRLHRPSVWLGRSTWLVLLLVFIGLLGGTHPADDLRDRVLTIAAGVIVALNLPSVLLLGLGVTRNRGRGLLWVLLGLLFRLGVSYLVLDFCASISHERPMRPPSAGAPLPVGMSLHPPRRLFFTDAAWVPRLRSASKTAVRVSSDLLTAPGVVLIPFDDSRGDSPRENH